MHSVLRHTVQLQLSCHVNLVAIDVYKTCGYNADCQNTPAARVLENAQNVEGFVAVFFLQSRSAVLDCGHTPGQHAQCLVTHATHIQCFNFFLGSWLLASQQIAMVNRNLDVNSDALTSAVA